MSDEIIELHAVVKGHVQGVFFRATVCKHAEALSLCGSVKNLEDGSVEIYAQGAKNQLDKLIEKIKSEPGAGRVDAVAVALSKPTHMYTLFRVIR